MFSNLSELFHVHKLVNIENKHFGGGGKVNRSPKLPTYFYSEYYLESTVNDCGFIDLFGPQRSS